MRHAVNRLGASLSALLLCSYRACMVAAALVVSLAIAASSAAADPNRLIFANQLPGSALSVDQLPGSNATTLAAPDRAITRGVAGRALTICKLTPGGHLIDCIVPEGTETPKGYGFADAAKRTAEGTLFRSIGPMPIGHVAVSSAWEMQGNKPPAATELESAILVGAVRNALLPQGGAPLTVPIFQSGPSDAVAAYGPMGRYFPERAAKAGLGGVAVLECGVVAGRKLEPCLSLGEAPQQGFSGSAIRMAHDGYMRAPDEAEVGSTVRIVVQYPPPR